MIHWKPPQVLLKEVLLAQVTLGGQAGPSPHMAAMATCPLFPVRAWFLKVVQPHLCSTAGAAVSCPQGPCTSPPHLSMYLSPPGSGLHTAET